MFRMERNGYNTYSATEILRVYVAKLGLMVEQAGQSKGRIGQR